jgi:hypothetical protein
MPKSSTSPTQRTIAALKKKGFTCAVVEKWVPLHGPAAEPSEGAKFSAAFRSKAGGFHKDVWGFIDILVLDGQQGSLAVQACGATGFAEHLRKIDAIDEVRLWLAAGNRLELWSWRKAKVDGKDKWEAKVAPLVEYNGHIVTSYRMQAEEVTC